MKVKSTWQKMREYAQAHPPKMGNKPIDKHHEFYVYFHLKDQ